MFKKIFLQSPLRCGYWITFAVIVKGLFFLFLISERATSVGRGLFYAIAGDTGYYINPIENLLKAGIYDPDFRMPGYGAIYFLFRVIFSKEISLNLLVFAQLFLSALSVYILALIVKEIFNSTKWFYISFYAYLVSTYVSIFDIFILTESFIISSLIFSVFYLVKAINKLNYTALFLSGIFLAWCVFLRPVCLPLFGFFIFLLTVIWKREHKYNYYKIAKGVFIFLLPFLLIESVWIARNYKVHRAIIPMQTHLMYPDQINDKVFMSLFLFVQSWGGDFSWWDPKAEINWFEYIDNREDLKRQIKNVDFPKYIYTSKFDNKDLLAIKEYIALLKDKSLPKDKRDEYAQIVANSVNEYTHSIKKEKPYVYYVYAPLRLFVKFLFHSGTYNLFNRTYAKLNVIELMFKVLMSLIYIFVVIGGSIGILILFFRNYVINKKLLIPVLSLYFITIFPFVFRYCEYRYFAIGYPFMLICALYFCLAVCGAKRLIRHKQA
ncbi:MAG: hypothetical protein Q8O12_02220 [Candidatus Omnitrophota bacterium]|nr:hypothetical protein [Candidatus Omnitrophota bacterium]